MKSSFRVLVHGLEHNLLAPSILVNSHFLVNIIYCQYLLQTTSHHAERHQLSNAQQRLYILLLVGGKGYRRAS